jgi:hypothetical protein
MPARPARREGEVQGAAGSNVSVVKRSALKSSDQ